MGALINKEKYMTFLLGILGGFVGALFFSILSTPASVRQTRNVDTLARKAISELASQLGGRIHFYNGIQEVNIFGLCHLNQDNFIISEQRFRNLVKYLGLKYVDKSTEEKPAGFIKDPEIKRAR